MVGVGAFFVGWWLGFAGWGCFFWWCRLPFLVVGGKDARGAVGGSSRGESAQDESENKERE